MKKCPTYNQTYADDTLSFCLDDGTLLSKTYDPDETLVLGSDDPTVRSTNPGYDPEKSTATVFTESKLTSSAIGDVAASNISPHLIYACAGLISVGLIDMSFSLFTTFYLK